MPISRPVTKETLPPEFASSIPAAPVGSPSDSLVIGKNFAEVLARPGRRTILRRRSMIFRGET